MTLTAWCKLCHWNALNLLLTTSQSQMRSPKQSKHNRCRYQIDSNCCFMNILWIVSSLPEVRPLLMRLKKTLGSVGGVTQVTAEQLPGWTYDGRTIVLTTRTRYWASAAVKMNYKIKLTTTTLEIIRRVSRPVIYICALKLKRTAELFLMWSIRDRDMTDPQILICVTKMKGKSYPCQVWAVQCCHSSLLHPPGPENTTHTVKPRFEWSVDNRLAFKFSQSLHHETAFQILRVIHE